MRKREIMWGIDTEIGAEMMRNTAMVEREKDRKESWEKETDLWRKDRNKCVCVCVWEKDDNNDERKEKKKIE